MKKYAMCVIVVAFIAAALVLTTPNNVQATVMTPTPSYNPEWSGGPEVALDPEEYPAPDEWSVAYSKGVEVSASGQICYPFRKGTYGWTGTIYKWAGNNWQAIDTTLAWVPDTEGQFMACAYAPSAGLYMFYGYFDPDLAPEKEVPEEPLT